MKMHTFSNLSRNVIALLFLAMMPSHGALLFRLPLSSDTTVHYYYDHNSTSGVQDWNCGSRTYDGHRGTDFSGGPRGRAIFAAAAGTLEYKIDGFGDGFFGNTDGGGGGNSVRLGHSDGFKTYYFHMNIGTPTSKTVGSAIACGEQIGGVGTSGNSTGLHLHFEPKQNGFADDPYSGTCGGPTSWWVNQGTGAPTTNCFTLAPSKPTNLVASAVSTNQIKLAWADTAANETSFRIERGATLTGPWSQIATVSSNIVSYTNSSLAPWTSYFFRVRASNSNGNSGYSNIAYTNTLNTAPAIGGIADKIVNAGALLSFAVPSVDAGQGVAYVVADFENFLEGISSVMFRQPAYSSTTTAFLDASPDVTETTGNFPTTGNYGALVLNVNCSFKTGTTNAWLRLTTDRTAHHPNPTIHFKKQLSFSIYTEKSVKVGLGVRETGTSSALGGDGGITGTIEFVGVPLKNGASPNPSRVVPAGIWTNVQFNLPTEAVTNFTGNSVLGSATDKGVLECLAMVPNGGSGPYNLYLDNFVIFTPNAVTYSLDPGFPAGAVINSTNGALAWTAPQVFTRVTNVMTVRVTDNGSPALNSSRTFNIIVVPPPRVSNVSISNGVPNLTWQAFPGKTYRVQYKNSLNDLNWIEWASTVMASGDTVSFTDTTSPGSTRFYRIMQID